MNHEERIEKLEQIIKENVASISFLRGYIKGLEERLNRLEKPNHSQKISGIVLSSYRDFSKILVEVTPLFYLLWYWYSWNVQ